ncbi:hypothetical protein [Aeromonas media]|uniref:hypothetical protein n=1 Tax=Aeromonas media TaxID=651 RepID=UPI003D1D9EBB
MNKKYLFTYKVKDAQGHIGLHVHLTNDVIQYPEDGCIFIQAHHPEIIKSKIEVERVSSIPLHDKYDSDKRENREDIIYEKINDFMSKNNIVGFIWENPEDGNSVKYPEFFSK